MKYNYITNFEKSRELTIGASDIPWLIPHPERQIESLAAYTKDGKRHPCTAIDLYNQKIDPPPWETSFPAEMGHYLEPMALYKFIADNIDKKIAEEFYRGFQLHALEQRLQRVQTGQNVCVDPRSYNTTHFRHNTEASFVFGVAHADCVYDPVNGTFIPDDFYLKQKEKTGKKGNTKKTKIVLESNGLIIDLEKPFLIEAKSAGLYSAMSRKHDIYSGYDLALKEWQGIPLKVYFQVQFQMLVYGVDVAYVVLIFDTSKVCYWQIEANKSHQEDLLQLASHMVKCMKKKTPPKNLAINSKDIMSLYPRIEDDFREISGQELVEILEVSRDRIKASSQERKWKRVKEDCDERMAAHLKETGLLKGVVEGQFLNIAKWKKTGDYDQVMGLKEIRAREDSKTILNYFNRKGLVKKVPENRKPVVSLKAKEIDSIDIEGLKKDLEISEGLET